MESVRTEQGIKQRVVAHLGNLSEFTSEQWKSLAARLGRPEMAAKLQAHVEGPRRKRGRPRKSLEFEPPENESDVLPVRLSKISWEDPREYGDVYAGLYMWKRLGLADLVEENLRGRQHQIPMDLVAAILAVGRLVAPSSELKTSRWWRTTALPELLGIPPEAINEDRFYECLDLVWPLKNDIEKHLQREGETLFGQRYQVLLYDLSSTYFEGRAEGVPKAKRGYSRDRRPDCKQICFGVAVTGEGWPTGYETFEGDIKDHQTLEGLLKKLANRFGQPSPVAPGQDPQRVVVMDRGLSTDENLVLLRQAYYGYLLAERRARGAHWYWKRGEEKKWIVIRRDDDGQPEVEVQEIGRDGPDRLILARSSGCRRKEHGIHDRVLKRLKEDLKALQQTVQKGALKDPEKIHQRLGRLQERHGSLWKWVSVQVKPGKGEERSSLQWKVQPEVQEAVQQAEGVYLLRTNLPKRSAKELWEDYIRLTVVEAVFRAMKHDLWIRPIFHRKEDRVEAHLLFSFLGYVLYWTLEREHRTHGGQLTGRRLLEALRQVKLGTIRLKTLGGQDLQLKRVSTPAREIAEILSTLNLKLPRAGAEPPVLSLARKA